MKARLFVGLAISIQMLFLALGTNGVGLTQGPQPVRLTFQGRRYYLELLAAPGVPVGQGFRIHLRVESRLQQSKQEGR
jgi:hypothetical protein